MAGDAIAGTQLDHEHTPSCGIEGKRAHQTQIVHQKFERSNFIVINGIWDVQFAKELIEHLFIFF